MTHFVMDGHTFKKITVDQQIKYDFLMYFFQIKDVKGKVIPVMILVG